MSNRVLGNRYELLEKIGGGGMAVVYKAKCQLLNRYVAVKILRDEFTNDEEFVKRFRIEAQAAASLSHPNIVSIFDVGHEDNVHYIVMEYIDGITLKEYIAQKGALGWREAAGIAIQICSAIEQAHKNHIIHRDIKPHNILMTKEGIAKVTDFGIARAVSSSTITMVGSTIGSVHYFSPEQARGGFTDEKSDLYSLGITIYEMVTGRVPFDGDSPVAVALKHIQEKADRPQDINPKIPAAINDIIMKAMKKDQNQRYQSASELLADLHRAVRNPDMRLEVKDSIDDFPTKKMASLDKLKYEDKLKYIQDETTAEDDEEDMPRRKKDRLSVWLGIITGIIIVSIFGYIGFRIVIPAMLPEKSNEFIVGNYENKAFDLVKEELRRYNIEAVEDRRVFSDEVEKGYIVSQDVAPDMPLKPGSQIKFTVSDGPKMITIPNVAKKEYRLAEQNLKDMELVTKIEYEYSDDIATGYVVRTEPGAEEQVEPGSEVILYVSQGPELKQVKVPNLIGLQRAEAERLIQESGLTIGKRIPEDIVSDTALIIDQSPQPNIEVNEGTPVDLTYDVESEATNGTGTTYNTEPANKALKYRPYDVILDNPDKYGDEIDVYIAATPPGMETIVLVDGKISKKSFPISVDIPVTDEGPTYVLVEYNGVRIYESSI